MHLARENIISKAKEDGIINLFFLIFSPIFCKLVVLQEKFSITLNVK